MIIMKQREVDLISSYKKTTESDLLNEQPLSGSLDLKRKIQLYH